MSEQGESQVPPHLQELLQPTPSGTAKLCAAWDGLPADSQMAILSARKKQAGPAYLHNRIILKALGSENAFVRYLAARDLYLADGDPLAAELRAKIESDSDPLVRFAGLETPHTFLDPALKDADSFFALPHEARLAKVRRLTSSGERMAEILAYAAEHKLKDGTVTERELFEILSDYLNKDEFKRHYSEDWLSYRRSHPWSSYGAGEFWRGQDIEALWELVLKVPERISGVIIENLPQQSGVSSGIPAHVLKAMTDDQLGHLLHREDIGLSDLRKRKFFVLAQGDKHKTDSAKQSLRLAAISHNFDLTDEEFASILTKSAKSRVRDLKDLAMMAKDLRLCLLDAIHDALFVSDVSPTGSDFEYAAFARRNFERKLLELKGWQRDKQLLELKLYRLAVIAAPWKKDDEAFPPSGDLAFLADAVVERDPWATFMAFSRKWREVGYKAKRLERHLPLIWQAGEEPPPVFDEEVPPAVSEHVNIDDLAERIGSRLTKALKHALGESDIDSSKLASSVGEVVGQIVAEDRQALTVVQTKLADLVTKNTRLQVWLWIVVGLLVAILLTHR